MNARPWPSVTLEAALLSPAMLALICGPADSPERDAASYGLRKGLSLRDEIATAFRVGQAHHAAFARLAAPGREATVRFAVAFLSETFGHADLTPTPFGLSADGRLPVIVTPPSDPLDRRSAALGTSAAIALTDHLNGSDTALWGLATNGQTLRLARANPSLTRAVFIEADLAQMFGNDDLASFTLLWLLIHRSRFGHAPAPPADCALERWRDQGTRQGEAARDKLAAQVERALETLGQGFLTANPALRHRIGTQIPVTDWFNELLRLVYRLIFLMVAEDRNLLHPATADPDARDLYDRGYSLRALRDTALRRQAWDRHDDRYRALQITFHALAQGEPALGLPALGGLFDAHALPTLDNARLPNAALLEAVYRLGWLPGAKSLIRIDWTNMQTEELGSVYESLLELQPQIEGTRLIFAHSTTETKGNQRKTTGSYYTPDSLVQALLDTALTPVFDACDGAEDPATALLNLTVIDPACGSGHFLLAAARRIATRVAKHRHNHTPTPTETRHALREVARRCLHGVDRNPMAVELTKVALWIETVDPGLPLGLFDAQIRCGDALLGVMDLTVLPTGIPDAAFKALASDDKAVARHLLQKNRRERAEHTRIATGFGLARHKDFARGFQTLIDMPEDTVQQVEAKAAALTTLTASGAALDRLERACDLYLAAFLVPKVHPGQFAGPDGLPRRGAELVPTSGTLWEFLRGTEPFGMMVQTVTAATGPARPLHWPLAFPTVMARGGFDVALGNPPSEVMQLSEQEFFAVSHPEIANLPGAARKAAIDNLATADPAAHFAYVVAKRGFDAANEFARESDRFDLTARGKVNTCALFAELFSRLAGPKGRAGVIVPTGIATDATTAPFFAAMVNQRRLSQLVDFENSAPIFPSVHRSFKFCLLTLGRKEPAARFAFFLTEPGQLADPERNFTLTPRRHRPPEPQHPHRPGVPQPRGCRVDGEDLPQRPGAGG